MQMVSVLKSIFGGLVTVGGYLLGARDGMIMALLAMIIIDFISGVIVAIARRELDSRVMYMGGIKKVGILSIVAVGNILDVVLELGGMLRTLTISYFIANEGISLLENWSKIGLPVPEKLKRVLKQLRDDVE